MMGCGCGNKAGARRTGVRKYKVVFNDGTSKTYLSQADAEKARREQGATKPVEVVNT